MLLEMNEVDIAEFIDQLDENPISIIIFRLMPKEMAAEVFDKMATALKKERPEGAAVFGLIKKLFDEENASLKKKAASAKDKLDNTFAFMEKVWPDDNEMVIFVTELTANPDSVRFISRYGCEKYFAHNKELLFYERHKEIIAEIEEMEL